MATKPVTIKGLKFWMAEFIRDGKGWSSIERFLRKERKEGRIETSDIRKAKKSYFLHLSRHPERFPNILPKI